MGWGHKGPTDEAGFLDVLLAPWLARAVSKTRAAIIIFIISSIISIITITIITTIIVTITIITTIIITMTTATMIITFPGIVQGQVTSIWIHLCFPRSAPDSRNPNMMRCSQQLHAKHLGYQSKPESIP